MGVVKLYAKAEDLRDLQTVNQMLTLHLQVFVIYLDASCTDDPDCYNGSWRKIPAVISTQQHMS